MKVRTNELTDEFDQFDPEHFTHYDYLCQLVDNGQPSAFIEHIKTLTNESVLTLYKIVPDGTYKTRVRAEILERMK